MSSESEPQPPENVRLILSNGEVIGCEVVYGHVEEGLLGQPLHVWRVTANLHPLMTEGARLTMDVFPPNTALELDVTVPTEAEDGGVD